MAETATEAEAEQLIAALEAVLEICEKLVKQGDDYCQAVGAIVERKGGTMWKRMEALDEAFHG